VRSRQRLLCVLGIVSGAGLALLADGHVWVRQDVTDVPGVRVVTATGEQAASGVAALALAAGAGAVALLVAGRLAGRLAGLVVTLAGVGLVASVAAVVVDPRSAAAPAVPGVTGRAGPLADPAAASGWVWLTLVAGLLVAAAGALAAARAPAWSTAGRRFEQPPGDASGRASRNPGAGDRPAAEDPVAAWDALSRGEDPTA
jgi:uncharacterized membrane protein (TIGR02234 family)